MELKITYFYTGKVRKISKYLLLFLIVLILLSQARAFNDWCFSDQTIQRLPNIISMSDRMEVGDVDGDNDLDIIVACDEVPWPFIPGYEQIFINDGNGYFAQENTIRLPLINDETSSLLLFDIESDNDLDMLVGNAFLDTNYIAINNGIGEFTIDLTRMPVTTSALIGANFGDVDNDNDLDLYISLNYHLDLLLINNGDGFFFPDSQRIPEITEGSTMVNLVDLDGDLDLDIVLAGYPANAKILINDGNGYFADETPNRIATENILTGNVRDIDNDDDIDILLIPLSNCLVYINNGFGYFTNETAERFPDLGEWDAADALTFADVDNDNDFDLVVAYSPYGRQHLLFNDGNGYFSEESSPFPQYHLNTRDCFFADYDGDGDSDYFRVGNSDYGNHIYINNYNFADSIPPQVKNSDVLNENIHEPGPYRLRCMVDDGISLVGKQMKAVINYSTDSISFNAVPMSFIGGYLYAGEIPAVDSGITVYYYYVCKEFSGNYSTRPNNAPDSLYSFVYLPGQSSQVGESYDNYPDPQMKIYAYPNPFNSFVTIATPQLKGGDNIIEIFNLSGMLVQTLKTKEGKANWDASDNSGRKISSGIYFARARAPQKSNTLKLLYLK